MYVNIRKNDEKKLEAIESVLYYAEMDSVDRLPLMFATDADRIEATFVQSRFDEARENLKLRIKDNLHFILANIQNNCKEC